MHLSILKSSQQKIKYFIAKFEHQDISDDNLFHQGGDHGLGIETFEVWVGLPGAHKHNGLATDVSHRNCRADLEKTRAHQTQIIL